MADITMCANPNCPLESSCLRKQAYPNKHWQSYALFHYKSGEEVTCDHYIETKTEVAENE